MDVPQDIHGIDLGPSPTAYERAEQVLGRSLKQPSTVAAIYIALVAEAADQSGAATLD